MATQHDTIGVLTGWKSIAAFIKRDERTAMRWAAHRGLPVRRVPGGKRGPVYASAAEIVEWLQRSDSPPPDTPAVATSAEARNDASPPPPLRAVEHAPMRLRLLLPVMLAGALAGSVVTAVALSVAPVESTSCAESAVRPR